MPFQKGQSGNPGGRPSKAREELDKLLMGSWPVTRRRAALKRLADMAEGDDADQALNAIRLLLAYAYGKPTERQEQAHEGGMTIRVLYDDADPNAEEAP